MFCHPEYTKTAFSLYCDYIKEKQTNPELRFGQYFLNTVYPKLGNSDIFYHPEDDKVMARILKNYCDSNGNFQNIL